MPRHPTGQAIASRRHRFPRLRTDVLPGGLGGAPPLYRVYQQEWGFSATLLTVVFGAYALALLTALLTAGRLSDHIGRRPVIALALLLQSVAMCGFLLASGPGWLVGARLLQGAATGLATASVGAALLDLHRERGALINGISPMIGMAAGALGSTALLVHAPDPLHTVYALLLALFLLALALLWRVPETATRRDGAWASLRPRITVPPQAARRCSASRQPMSRYGCWAASTCR